MSCIPMFVQKNTLGYGLINIDRLGKRFISFVLGDRSTKKVVKLWDKIKKVSSSRYYTVHWSSYREFISKEKPVQGKAETYTVEGYNSLIRHYLARFKRKGKCYSKAEHIVEKPLNLLFLKLNNQLHLVS